MKLWVDNPVIAIWAGVWRAPISSFQFISRDDTKRAKFSHHWVLGHQNWQMVLRWKFFSCKYGITGALCVKAKDQLSTSDRDTMGSFCERMKHHNGDYCWLFCEKGFQTCNLKPWSKKATETKAKEKSRISSTTSSSSVGKELEEGYD